MLLSRDQILGAKDIDTREVDVPEWGGAVLVRALSITEGNEWRRSMLRPVAKTDPKTRETSITMEFSTEAAELANVRMLSIACIDAEGNRLFKPEDIEALGKHSMTPIARVVEVVMDISGLTKKAADDAEKNSEPSLSVSGSIN